MSEEFWKVTGPSVLPHRTLIIIFPGFLRNKLNSDSKWLSLQPFLTVSARLLLWFLKLQLAGLVIQANGPVSQDWPCHVCVSAVHALPTSRTGSGQTTQLENSSWDKL